jgi:dihydrofolate synthase/folylpolyglutamate synthase
VNDKDLDEILPLFPTTAQLLFLPAEYCRVDLAQKSFRSRQHQTTILRERHTILFQKLTTYALRKRFKKNDFIYVGGSTFVVAEIL